MNNNTDERRTRQSLNTPVDPTETDQNLEKMADGSGEVDPENEEPEPETEGNPGDLTDENVDSHQDVLTDAENANQASVNALETGITEEDEGIEEIVKAAENAAETNQVNQEEFSERTKEEIEKAENIKGELEASGNIARVNDEEALDFNSDLDTRSETWINAFVGEEDSEDVIALETSLDYADKCAMRSGVGSEGRTLYKGLFDGEKNESGENNRQAAGAATEHKNFADKWDSEYESEIGALESDVESFLDQLHLVDRDSGDAEGEKSVLENLSNRVEQYEDTKETATESIQSYEEADSENDPSVSDRAKEAVENLLGVVEDENEDGKKGFDVSEKEEVKKSWTMTRLAGLESIEDTLETAENYKSTLEDAKEEVEDRRQDVSDLLDDVGIKGLEEYGEKSEQTLVNEIEGVDNILDLASMSDGGDITSKLPDGPRDEEPTLGPANKSTEDAAYDIVEKAKKRVFGTAEEDGLVDQYLDSIDTETGVDAKLEEMRDNSAGTDQMKLQQLNGKVSYADDLARDLANLDEQLESEIDSYDDTMSEIEEDLDDYDSLESYVEGEKSEIVGKANELLPETDQIEA